MCVVILKITNKVNVKKLRRSIERQIHVCSDLREEFSYYKCSTYRWVHSDPDDLSQSTAAVLIEREEYTALKD